jgi:hypothetical protein
LTVAAENSLPAAALFYATKLHWPVFPLKPRAKEPLTEHGFKDATTDEQQIREWWTKWPHANIGVPTGIEFFVVDKDPRHGGEETLSQLEHRHTALPDTIQQITGRRDGGRHYLLAVSEKVAVGCLNLGPGLDIKGKGGYIVVAPSVHPDTGKEYIWDGAMPVHKQPILPAPPWLLIEIEAAQHPHTHCSVQVPEQIKKGVQHDTLFRMGSSMRAKGFGEAEIFAALWEANKARCEEPGPEENIRKLAASICAQYPPGQSNGRPPEAAPTDAEAPPERKERPKKKVEPLFTLRDVPNIFTFEAPPIRYIIPDLILEAGVNMITGDSGHGKSILAMAIAGAIISGGKFLGRECAQRKVVYLDRENPVAVVKQRLYDLHIAENPNLIYWGGWCKQEPDGPASQVLLEFAAEEKPVFIFDSLVAFHTGDEQDATETRRFMRLFRRLADVGATVILLHHIGKAEAAKFYRGSSDIKANIDCAWLLEKLGENPAAKLNELRLVPFKDRLVGSEPISISFRDGGFLVSGERPPSPKEILEKLLRNHPHATARTLRDLGMAAGLAKHVTESWLLQGVAEGWIQVELGSHNSKHFSLAVPGLEI